MYQFGDKKVIWLKFIKVVYFKMIRNLRHIHQLVTANSKDTILQI
jgi:hypothetical protein